MKLVRARLGLHRDNTCDSLAELGVIVLQCDLRLLDGVEIRIHHDDPQNRVLVVCPVQLEGGAAEVLAIHENLLAALRIFRGGVAPSDKLLRPWGEQLEAGEIAVKDRKIFDIFFVELNRNILPVCLKLRNLPGHLDALRDGSHLKLSVNVCARISRYLHAGNVCSLEAGSFNPNLVRVRDQVSNCVVSTLVCSGFGCRTFGYRSHRDLRARHLCALRVGHRAENASINGLRQRS